VGEGRPRRGVLGVGGGSRLAELGLENLFYLRIGVNGFHRDGAGKERRSRYEVVTKRWYATKKPLPWYIAMHVGLNDD